jgi:hypothetical protein
LRLYLRVEEVLGFDHRQVATIYPAGIHRTFADLLRRLNHVARGWCGYFWTWWRGPRCGNVRESRRQHCRACAAETGQLGDPSGRVSTESLLIIRAASSSDPDWRSYPASERRTLGMFLVDS